MSKRKLLIVDDEVAIRNMYEQAFSRGGYKVRSAESAEEALEFLKDEKIQVMFLDLNTPGMNGLDLCKEVRKDFPMAIIHAVTGYSSLFELADCREAGFDDYFTKPADLKMLLRAAQDAFEKIDRWKKR
jgi:DNA-binding response OmpR family regulator